MKDKFEMLNSQNIKKCVEPRDPEQMYAIDLPYYSTEKIPAKRSGILQDLFFLSRTLIEGVNLKNIEALMLVEDWMFNENHVFNYLSEKEKNNKLFQDMNIA